MRLLAGEGKTIFISSHILSELGEMCDTLLFIDAGQIVHHGSKELLQNSSQAGAIVDVQIAGDAETLARWIELQPGVKLVEVRKCGARIAVDDPAAASLAELLRRMILDGVPVSGFQRETRRLEDAFVEMLRRP